jgi:hypothetical protein
MNRMIWIAASILIVVGLAAGCSGSSTTSKPATTGTNSGAPKNETKTNVGKGGLENPPPP